MKPSVSFPTSVDSYVLPDLTLLILGCSSSKSPVFISLGFIGARKLAAPQMRAARTMSLELPAIDATELLYVVEVVKCINA